MASDDETPTVTLLPENNGDITVNDHDVLLELGELDCIKSKESLGFSDIETDDKRFGAYSKVSLSWQDVKVSVTIEESSGPPCCRRGKGKVIKHILKGVSGVVKPGEFVAIMGASGAGKTTLLNTLAMKNDHSLNESGSILINGQPITRRKTTLLSAYVQQEDFFIGTLTVKEVLMFHATLRMGRGISHQEKKDKVNRVMKELGLKKIENSLCGMPGGIIRGISGGERKRLSVACELLMNPPLLFIDEPTSGLDSFMCRNIVKLIGKLAKANRTILCTIHQPTSEVFAMFDQLYLVAEGKCAYSGTSKDALTFFQSIGRPCPENFNPADHYIFTLAIVPGEVEECKKKVDEITEAFSKSEHYEALLREIESSVNTDPDDVIKTSSLENSTSMLGTQICANFGRSWKNITRNPGYTRIRVVQVLVLALLGGLAYMNVGNGQESVQDKSGLLFFLVTSLSFSNIFMQSQNIPLDLPIIKREYRNGMYGVLAALIPRFILEIPYLFVLSLVQWVIVWALAGLRRNFVNFLIGYVVQSAVAVIATAVGYFIATAAGNPVIAAAVAPLLILPFFLFGGLYQNEASTPYYFYPVKYGSWFRYSYGMLLINEFQDSELTCETQKCIYEDGNAVLEYFNLDPADLWFPNMFAILVMAVGYLGLAVLFLWLRVREKRKTIKDKSS